jgi:CubicO group peptidase (beta-lactamase class C family)
MHAAIDAIVQRYADNGDFSGVVLVRRRGADVYRRAVGLAPRGFGIPNRVDTRFRLASIGKLFTAIATLQLIENGDLSLESTVVDRLGLGVTTVPDTVSVWHLLTMTAGIADWLDENSADVDEDWARLRREVPIDGLRDNADYLPLFTRKPPVSAVGARHVYSNACYILLGLLIEQTAGQPYTDFVRAHVFAPAGMRGAGFDAIDDIGPGVAEGYLPPADGSASWRKNFYAVTPSPSADGGATATAEDLVRLLDALRGGRLLSAASTEQLVTPKVVERDQPVRGYRWHFGFGLSFLLDDDGTIVRYARPGEEDVVSCRLFHYPSRDVDVVILATTAAAPCGSAGTCTTWSSPTTGRMTLAVERRAGKPRPLLSAERLGLHIARCGSVCPRPHTKPRLRHFGPTPAGRVPNVGNLNRCESGSPRPSPVRWPCLRPAAAGRDRGPRRRRRP